MGTATQFEQTVFRILLYRNNATEVLVEVEREGLRLPTVVIPAHTRVAEEITGAIKSLCNLETYCLFTVPSNHSSDMPAHFEVLELWRPEPAPPPCMQWFPVLALSAESFRDAIEFSALEKSLQLLNSYHLDALPGVFGKPGWLQTVTEWVGAQAAKSGLRLTGNFRHLNSSPTFSLLRFETDARALWFKAVGEPNLHELPVTRQIESLLPGFVPQVLAWKPEWNAWLSMEAEGVALDRNSSLQDWRAAASTLAVLQIKSSGNGLHLIASGSKDLRAQFLLDRVGPFFGVVSELMEQQAKPIPPRMDRDEIAALASKVGCGLESLANSSLPDVLGHLDMNPGNILVARNRCVFLDWAEAYVGHPFFTLQYLVEHGRRTHAPDASVEKALLGSYTKSWRKFASAKSIAEDLRWIPLLAAFAYAAGGLAWTKPEIARRPEIAPFLRSLTRRMQREAQILPLRRPVCAPS